MCISHVYSFTVFINTVTFKYNLNYQKTETIIRQYDKKRKIISKPSVFYKKSC